MSEPGGDGAEQSPASPGSGAGQATAPDEPAGVTTMRPGPWQKSSSRTRARRSTIWLVALVIIGGFGFATVFAYGVSKLSAKSPAAHMPRPSGIPAGVSTSLAYLMQLSTVPTRTAPNFTLTDQNGHPLSLASLRGKTVVLTFMDPHCTDICPLVSREFLDARRDLGAAGRNVVFVAVNVNRYHGGIDAMAAYTRRMQLSTMPSWHFVTGALPALRKVWKDYQIYVDAPNPNADVIHTSLIYFIDPKGQERYVVAPMADHTKKGMAYLPPGQVDKWGHGIALMARAVSG